MWRAERAVFLPATRVVSEGHPLPSNARTRYSTQNHKTKTFDYVKHGRHSWSLALHHITGGYGPSPAVIATKRANPPRRPAIGNHTQSEVKAPGTGTRPQPSHTSTNRRATQAPNSTRLPVTEKHSTEKHPSSSGGGRSNKPRAKKPISTSYGQAGLQKSCEPPKRAWDKEQKLLMTDYSKR